MMNTNEILRQVQEAIFDKRSLESIKADVLKNGEVVGASNGQEYILMMLQVATMATIYKRYDVAAYCAQCAQNAMKAVG